MSVYPHKTIVVMSPRWAAWLFWARSNGVSPAWRKSSHPYRWYKIGRPIHDLLNQHPNLNKIIILSIAGVSDGYHVLNIGQFARENNIKLEEVYLK